MLVNTLISVPNYLFKYNEKYESDFLLDGNEGDADEWGYTVPPEIRASPPDSAT